MHILIVEDEGEILKFLKNSFVSEGFVIDSTMDGTEGSFLARVNEYDLIILDNALPGKSGKQICREIREDGSSVPIIMLSIINDIETKVDLLNSGADDYLSKPFSFSELHARVNALLRRPKEIEKETYEIDDLVMDIKKCSVTRGGKKIHLRLKEFSLLEYLLKNKGAFMSRRKIIEHVWDTDFNSFSNTVEAHILNLRKKISKGNRKKLIFTIPRRGYKIDLER